ncbi:MAG: hypothetical protein H7A22_04645 [Spirochaetales bacterium]|nr:hypothetical protein [Spirochaetales bacterium]
MEALPQKPTVEIEIIKTRGDVNWIARSLRSPVNQTQGAILPKSWNKPCSKGASTAAIHSFKDLPTENPAGLTLACTPPREIRKTFCCSGSRRVAVITCPSSPQDHASAHRLFAGRNWFAIIGPTSRSLTFGATFRPAPARLFDSDPDRRVEALLLAAAGMKRLRAAGAFADALWSDRPGRTRSATA